MPARLPVRVKVSLGPTLLSRVQSTGPTKLPLKYSCPGSPVTCEKGLLYLSCSGTDELSCTAATGSLRRFSHGYDGRIAIDIAPNKDMPRNCRTNPTAELISLPALFGRTAPFSVTQICREGRDSTLSRKGVPNHRCPIGSAVPLSEISAFNFAAAASMLTPLGLARKLAVAGLWTTN